MPRIAGLGRQFILCGKREKFTVGDLEYIGTSEEDLLQILKYLEKVRVARFDDIRAELTAAGFNLGPEDVAEKMKTLVSRRHVLRNSEALNREATTYISVLDRLVKEETN